MPPIKLGESMGESEAETTLAVFTQLVASARVLLSSTGSARDPSRGGPGPRDPGPGPRESRLTENLHSAVVCALANVPAGLLPQLAPVDAAGRRDLSTVGRLLQMLETALLSDHPDK